jgi:hypothetical protein
VIGDARDLAAAARRPAGTRLHAAQDETLAFYEVDVRVHQHVVGPFLQENLEAVYLERRIALQGRFGYVHSQGGASAAGDHKDPHPVAGGALFFHDILELCYRAIRQTYHYFLLDEILLPACFDSLLFYQYIQNIATVF